MWVFLVKTHSTAEASVYTISENAIAAICRGDEHGTAE